LKIYISQVTNFFYKFSTECACEKKNIKNLSIFGDDVDFLGPTCIIGESLINQCWVDYFVNVICYNLQLHVTAPKSNHRLRGSASPVLTATHHSYGSLAWLSDFPPHAQP